MKTFGLLREIEYDGEKIRFKASTGLFFLYKSLFGTDLLDDLLKYFETIKKFDAGELEKIQDIQESDLEEMSEEEQDHLLNVAVNLENFEYDSTIIAKLLCALIMNAAPESERVGMPDALDCVPPGFLTDKDAIQTAIEMILPFYKQKKN